MKKTLKRILAGLGIFLLIIAGYYCFIRKLDRDVMEAAHFYQSAPPAGGPQLLAARFIDGERFYLKAPSQNGDTLLCFGDTGGGISMAMPGTAERAGIGAKVKLGLLRGLLPLRYILFGDLFPGGALPAPVPMRHMQLRRPIAAEQAPFLLIPPEDEELRMIAKTIKPDVFLGQNFFMGKAWTIDYPRRQVWVGTPLSADERGRPGVQQLGFRKNAAAEKTFGHPSMHIEVDGELIDVLFDTGATIMLSDSGKAALRAAAASIGGSFIAGSIFDKWRQTHPDWPFFKSADNGRDVIEVPRIRIGDYETGPVLFAKRDDEVWSQGMIQTMDRVVRGAVGGSALKYFRVTIDYNSELIRFEPAGLQQKRG